MSSLNPSGRRGDLRSDGKSGRTASGTGSAEDGNAGGLGRLRTVLWPSPRRIPRLRFLRHRSDTRASRAPVSEALPARWRLRTESLAKVAFRGAVVRSAVFWRSTICISHPPPALPSAWILPHVAVQCAARRGTVNPKSSNGFDWAWPAAKVS